MCELVEYCEGQILLRCKVYVHLYHADHNVPSVAIFLPIENVRAVNASRRRDLQRRVDIAGQSGQESDKVLGLDCSCEDIVIRSVLITY